MDVSYSDTNTVDKAAHSNECITIGGGRQYHGNWGGVAIVATITF